MEILNHIDNLLSEIASLRHVANKVKEDWDWAISELEKTYGTRLQEIKAKIKEKEKEINEIARSNKGFIFGDTDRRELTHGVLFLQVIERVKRARNVTVEKLKELGYLDAVKVIEKVNWDIIEKWPEEKLIAAGTERVKKEEIKYEIHDL